MKYGIVSTAPERMPLDSIELSAMLAHLNTVWCLLDAVNNSRNVNASVRAIAAAEQRLFAQIAVQHILVPQLSSFLRYFLNQTFDLGIVERDILSITEFADERGMSSVGCLVLNLCAELSRHEYFSSSWLRRPLLDVTGPHPPRRPHFLVVTTDDAPALRIAFDPAAAPQVPERRGVRRSRTGTCIVDPFQAASDKDEHKELPRRNVRRHRSCGIRPLPAELQRMVLEMLPPRNVASAAAVCALWRSLTAASPLLQQRQAVSAAVGQAYEHFFREDWGERFLDVASWTLWSSSPNHRGVSLRNMFYDWAIVGASLEGHISDEGPHPLAQFAAARSSEREFLPELLAEALSAAQMTLRTSAAPQPLNGDPAEPLPPVVSRDDLNLLATRFGTITARRPPRTHPQ